MWGLISQKSPWEGKILFNLQITSVIVSFTLFNHSRIFRIEHVMGFFGDAEFLDSLYVPKKNEDVAKQMGVLIISLNKCMEEGVLWIWYLVPSANENLSNWYTSSVFCDTYVLQKWVDIFVYVFSGLLDLIKSAGLTKDHLKHIKEMKSIRNINIVMYGLTNDHWGQDSQTHWICMEKGYRPRGTDLLWVASAVLTTHLDPVWWNFQIHISSCKLPPDWISSEIWKVCHTWSKIWLVEIIGPLSLIP